MILREPIGRAGEIPAATVQSGWKKRGVFELNNVSLRTKNLSKMGILAAISIVLVVVVHFPIFPALAFLEYDPADIPILLGTFAMGPVQGLLITIVVVLIQAFGLGGNGLYGALMHFIATGIYVTVAGNLYKKKKTKKRAIVALICGVVSWVLVMIPANLFITSAFMGVPRAVIVQYLPMICLFNLIKAGVNSVLTFFLYKRVSPILHK